MRSQYARVMELAKGEEGEDMGYISGHCGGSRKHENCRGEYAGVRCDCSCHVWEEPESVAVASLVETIPLPEPVAVVETIASPVFSAGSSVMVTYANGMCRTLHNVTAITEDAVVFGSKGRELSYAAGVDMVEVLI